MGYEEGRCGLIVRAISFQDFQPDRRTTCNLNTALCTIVHRAVKIGPYRLRIWRGELSGNRHFCTHRVADVDIDACVQTFNDLMVGAGTGGAQKTEDAAYLGRSLQHTSPSSSSSHSYKQHDTECNMD